MPTMSSSVPRRALESSTLHGSHLERALHTAHDFSIEAAPSADFLLFPDKTATMLSPWALPCLTTPTNVMEAASHHQHLSRGAQDVATPPGKARARPKEHAPVPETGDMTNAIPGRCRQSDKLLFCHSNGISKPKESCTSRGNTSASVTRHRPSRPLTWHLPMFDPLTSCPVDLMAPLAGTYDHVEPHMVPVQTRSGSQGPSAQIGQAEPGYWESSSTQAATYQSHDWRDIDMLHSMPPTPGPERLPTPDLPQIDAPPFCDCCTDVYHDEACPLIRYRKSQRHFDLLGVGSMFN